MQPGGEKRFPKESCEQAFKVIRVPQQEDLQPSKGHVAPSLTEINQVAPFSLPLRHP